MNTKYLCACLKIYHAKMSLKQGNGSCIIIGDIEKVLIFVIFSFVIGWNLCLKI